MEIEKQRGISVTSSVMQFEYDDKVISIMDTPGHNDFGEDTYRIPVSYTHLRCKTPPHCPRNMRPFQCRTYPLAPHITEEGVLILIKNDEELPYECPLIRDDIHLSESFVKATYTVWSHLLRDPLIYDLVEMDSAARDIDDNLQR